MVIVLVLCIRKMIESLCITVCILTVEVIVTMYANFSWSCVAWFLGLRSTFIDEYLPHTYFEMNSPLMLRCIKTIKHYSSITMSGITVVLVIHSSCHFTYCFSPDFGPFKSHRLLHITESSTLKLNHLFGLPCRTIVSKLIWIHMMLVLLLVFVHCEWNFVAIFFSLLRRDTM